MALRLEDYALIADDETAALVGADGSIDWFCVPRVDSAACFAALLGTPENGRWLLAPPGATRCTRRRYREHTLVLETEFETPDGVVRVIDGMTARRRNPNIVRIVEGVRGRVPMRMELVVRLDYGHVVPWVRRCGEDTLTAIAGPDALCLRTAVEHRGEGFTTAAAFTVAAAEPVPFTLTWYRETQEPPPEAAPLVAMARTGEEWRHWCAAGTYDGRWREAVEPSL